MGHGRERLRALIASWTRCSRRERRASPGPSDRGASVSSRGLYERRVIKDALAYLALLTNPDDIVALARAISSPRRGVGDATIAAIARHAREARA